MKRSYLLIVSALLIASMVSLMNPVSGDGATDIDLTVSWNPVEPVVGDPLNVSLSSNKTVESAIISYCLVDAGTCNMPSPMANDGTGMQFYFDYDDQEFPNDTADFHINITYDGGKHTIKQFFATFRAIPKELILFDLIPDNGSLISLFPNQTAEISGHLEYDLDTFDLQNADVNLSIRDSTVSNVTDIDENGNFTVGMFFPEESDFVIDLKISEEDFGLTASGEWDVSVSSWPKPAIGISGEIEYDPLETPPGSVDIYYRNATLNASYEVSNTGTGMANNLTINVTIENSTYMDEIVVGNLSHPDNRYQGIMGLDSNMTGNFTLVITVEWDQIAPLPENFTFPVWTYQYTIVEPPQWEPHTVLVEMFTQSDCAPCVFVEEALERLLPAGEDFTLITYALDDDISFTTAQARGVTSTPHIFIDYGIQEIIGGNDTESSMLEITSAISEASRRDTPPALIDFTEIDSNATAMLSLPGSARDPISGTFTIYRIEEFSNLRNHQGIPMADRFLGEIGREFVDSLEPGEWLNISIDDLAPGEGLVAVYYGEDGNVLQSSSYKTHMDPEVYLAKTSSWLKIETPGSDIFNITIDHFEFQELDFDPVDFQVSLDKEIPGILVTGPDGQTVDMNWTSMTFDKAETDMMVKAAGRVRYHTNFTFDVDIPGNLSGTYSFKIRVSAGPKIYTNSVAVTATPVDDDTPEPLVVHDYKLIGEGQNIFFLANITGVPDGASVHGRILPCMEDSGVCGVPLEIVLVEDENSPGTYRGSVVGIDIDQYTHFTYYVWVDDQGTELTRTEDVKVEIKSLIEIEDEVEDNDGKDGNLIWLLIGPAAILILIIVVIVFVLLSRGKGIDEAPEEVEQEETEKVQEPISPEAEGEVTSGEIETGTAAPVEGEQTVEPTAAPEEGVGTAAEDNIETQPPVEPVQEPEVAPSEEIRDPVQEQMATEPIPAEGDPTGFSAPPEPPRP